MGSILKRVHKASKDSYGYRRHLDALKDLGKIISKNRVIRIMKENRIVAKYKKPFRVTTDSNHKDQVAPNILDRDFKAQKPNDKWVSDISYIPTQSGFLYLAVIIDLCSRMVIGVNMSSSLDRHLVLNAFKQACMRRGRPHGVLFHSDRGVQYTCDDFRRLLRSNNAIPSMSRKGNCWDNAVAESFFGTLKRELMLDRRFKNQTEARIAIFDYIETFYNTPIQQ